MDANLKDILITKNVRDNYIILINMTQEECINSSHFWQKHQKIHKLRAELFDILTFEFIIVYYNYKRLE